MTLLQKALKGELPCEEDLEEALYDICEEVHSSCDNNCPVYRHFEGDMPRKLGWGCDYFKAGKVMLQLVRDNPDLIETL